MRDSLLAILRGSPRDSLRDVLRRTIGKIGEEAVSELVPQARQIAGEMIDQGVEIGTGTVDKNVLVAGVQATGAVLPGGDRIEKTSESGQGAGSQASASKKREVGSNPFPLIKRDTRFT